MSTELVSTIAELRAHVSRWRNAGGTIGMVPTMGALHEGHMSLVNLSQSHASHTIVSIFVNPRQFGPNEDLDRYPKNIAADMKLLEREDNILLFAPTCEEVFPKGHSTLIEVSGLGDILEGKFRPGFFSGVATVVAKLFIQANPDIAIFGEKDYQQLLVIRQLVRDLDLPVRIIAAPIIREKDGLAMSSRNSYLTADERRSAPALYRELTEAAKRVGDGEDLELIVSTGKERLARAGFDGTEYFEIRDAETLKKYEPPKDRGATTGSARVLAAATLGRTRLIDNVAVPQRR